MCIGKSQKNKLAHKAPVWFIAVLVLLSLVKIVLQFWITTKGYDIWDEGWYLIIINFYKHYPTEPHSYYGAVLSKILPITFNLVNLRILGTVSEIAGIILLSSSFWYWFNKQSFNASNYKLRLWTIPFVLASASFASVYTRSFSYNDFSYLLLVSICSIVFLMFANNSQKSLTVTTKRVVSIMIIGALMALLLIIKFSTFLLMLIWVSAFLGICMKNNLKHAVWLLFVMFSSLIASILLAFSGFSAFFTWFENLQEGIKMLRLLAYDPYGIFIQGYLKVDLFENAIYYLLPLGIARTSYYILPSTLSKGSNMLIAYLIGIAIWLLMSITIVNAFLGEFYYRYIALHIYTLLFLGIPVAKQLYQSKSWEKLCYATLIVSIPFIAIFGSNNPTTQTLTKYLATWYIAIAVLIINRFNDTPKIMYAFATAICFYAIANYTSVQLMNPYGVKGTVFTQNTQMDGFEYLKGVELDEESAQFFNSLKKTVKQSNYTAGNPILALGDLCGVVVAFGGYMPETFWYFSDQNATSPQHSRDFSCIHLANIKIDEYPTLPLIFINSGINQQVIDCLADSEVPFPEGYYLEQTIFNPYAEESLAVWVPINWELPAK